MPARIDLGFERRLQDAICTLIECGCVTTASDVSDGGLAIALAELALAGDTGLQVQLPDPIGDTRADAVLFGEAPSRIIVGIERTERSRLEETVSALGVPLTRLGTAGGDDIVFGNLISVSLHEARQRWSEGLDRFGRAQEAGGTHATE